MANNRHNKYFIFLIVLNIKIDSAYDNYRSYKFFSYFISNSEGRTEVGRSTASRECMRSRRVVSWHLPMNRFKNAIYGCSIPTFVT